MSDVSEHDPATGTPKDETEGSEGGTWATVLFYVGFLVVASGCFAIRALF